MIRDLLGPVLFEDMLPWLPNQHGHGVRNWRRGSGGGSIATGNRHTGKPHAHAREIARNQARNCK